MIPLRRISCHMERGITCSDVMAILTPLPSSDVNNFNNGLHFRMAKFASLPHSLRWIDTIFIDTTVSQ